MERLTKKNVIGPYTRSLCDLFESSFAASGLVGRSDFLRLIGYKLASGSADNIVVQVSLLLKGKRSIGYEAGERLKEALISWRAKEGLSQATKPKSNAPR